jgi:predicted GTPase
MVIYAGVDYADILRRADAEAHVIIWDGGNNDFPFYSPDLFVTVVDPLRPGHETSYHPGELNVRMADVIVVNKTDNADPAAAGRVVANVQGVNPDAVVVRAASPVTLDPGPSLAGKRVLVIEDGPTVTHGGMPYGAGTVAARQAGATLVDPRPYAAGSIVATYERYPTIGTVLPAMGYGDAQLADLARTVRATPCDAVVIGTPVDLGRLFELGHPGRRATYEYRDAGGPTLAGVLAPYITKWRAPS